MERSALLAAVKQVQPALASKDLIPIFVCLCFDKKGVVAYDDLIAIYKPIETPFSGAIRGDVLIPWLTSTRSKEIDAEIVKQDEGNRMVKFKAGRAKLTTQIKSKSEFLFSFPAEDAKCEVDITSEFLESLSKVSVSMGLDPSNAWALGVTVHSTGEALYLYTTKDVSATRVKVDQQTAKIIVVIPPKFCQLLVDLSKNDPPRKLMLTDSWITATFSSGAKMFSRAGAEKGLKQYKAMFDSAAEFLESGIPKIPKGLAHALDRAEVAINHSKDPFTSMRVEDGVLHLSTLSPMGDVHDRIKFKGHDNASVDMTPGLLAKALQYGERIKFSGTFIGVKGDNFDHLISGIVEETHAEEPTDAVEGDA